MTVTRRRLKGPARRALIVEAALAEFAVHGYDAASMGKLGAAAGVTRTVLYDHFTSKRELFASIVEAKRDELLDHLGRALEPGAATKTRMRAAYEAFFAFAEQQPLAWQLLYGSHAPMDPDVADDYERLRRSTNRLLAEMIAPDAERAGVDQRSNVAQAMFAAQLAAVRGAIEWWHAHPGVSRAEMVEAAMSALYEGVRGLENG